jgi:long-chain acyl-CoA synthetase
MIIGEYQKFASALIVPAFEKIEAFCTENGIKFSSNEEAIKNEKVKALIVREVEEVNKALAQYEKIKQPELLPKDWSVESGELTPKMSLKRKVIMKANAQLVEDIYSRKK